MKTKIVYCLVSDNEDYYYEQLLISLCSLRKHNPDVIVEVFCDKDTFGTLKGKRSSIYDYNINVIPVEAPSEWPKLEKSRYLKTNLRKLTKGDYLYIDTDTVICSSLDFIDKIAFDIAAVRDYHVDRPLPKFSRCRYENERWIWKEARKSNIDIEGFWQFNSGVMFVRDVPKSYELYSKWAEYYSKLLNCGVKVDQLSLLLSNGEMNNVISKFDTKMNCQVWFADGRKYIEDAAIIHYFPGKRKTLLSSPWIMDPIKETGRINSSVQRIIDCPKDFFKDAKKVVTKDEARLLDTPSLLEAFVACRKVFNVWMKVLNAYLCTKKRLANMIRLWK